MPLRNSRRPAADPRLGPVLGFMQALWDVDHALASASRRMKARLGVTGPERLAIRIVGELPDISPGELADVLHVDPSSLTGLLRRLVRRGLLSRRADPGDARRARLRLTPRGERIDRLRGGTVESAVEAALAALRPRQVAAAVQVLGVLSVRLALLRGAPSVSARRGSRSGPPSRAGSRGGRAA